MSIIDANLLNNINQNSEKFYYNNKTEFRKNSTKYIYEN
jgi:hypothetical protein